VSEACERTIVVAASNGFAEKLPAVRLIEARAAAEFIAQRDADALGADPASPRPLACSVPAQAARTGCRT
jgi:hypothetical protein